MARRLDQALVQRMTGLLFVFAVILLRIPNFFEPYWYGDEGIYLTLGNALRQGERLYAEIIDHKTPLIYFFAMTPSQLWFRVLFVSWMLMTTWLFYVLCQRWLKSRISVIVAMSAFVIFTTLPWLEGNIPNGELFMMGFIFWGAVFFIKLPQVETFFDNQNHHTSSAKNQLKKLLAAGSFFGLAILVKVPALFDAAAFAAIFWFAGTRDLLKNAWNKNLLSAYFKHLFWLGVGIGLPILISILYFVVRGSGQAYLDYGLLYNFRYAGSWQPAFSWPILSVIFTLIGKLGIVGVIGITLTVLSRKLTPLLQFSLFWFTLSLFASLLSNRPYPHYFLQVIPAFSLTIGAITELLLSHRITSIRHFTTALQIGTAIIILALWPLSWLALDTDRYPSISYYLRFAKLMTKQISWDEYRQSFNHLMSDNYQAAEIIKASGEKKLFIWGTNPTLYALSDTAPTGRFTVSFHIKDFKAYDETVRSVQTHQPLFVVTMNDETESLPGLEELLAKQYMPNQQFTNFTLWKRVGENTP